MKKTVMIYDDMGIKFAVLDGNYSHLDGVYINDKSGALQEELGDLIYDEAGKELITFVNKFPTREVVDGAEVIVCGFLA